MTNLRRQLTFIAALIVSADGRGADDARLVGLVTKSVITNVVVARIYH